MSKRKRRARRPDATGRSTGPNRFVRLHHYVLNSAAFRSLCVTARALLLEFHSLYNGSNNGELFLSVREAARRLGTSVNTARKALDELQERGFIRARQRGSFDWKSHQATTWIITEWAYGNELPTKDFMRWKPPHGAPIREPVSISNTDGIKA